MSRFSYNDMTFAVSRAGSVWEIVRELPGGSQTVVAAGLYPGIDDAEAAARAQALVRTIFPVGVRIVPPDVAHAVTIGDLKIVPPDVAHPLFAYWDKESVSA